MRLMGLVATMVFIALVAIVISTLGPRERAAEQAVNNQTQSALEVAQQAVDQAQNALQKAKQ
jgi:hypothetical protein